LQQTVKCQTHNIKPICSPSLNANIISAAKELFIFPVFLFYFSSFPLKQNFPRHAKARQTKDRD
jgi:hypothetical protein